MAAVTRPGDCAAAPIFCRTPEAGVALGLIVEELRDTLSDPPMLLREGTGVIHDKTGYGDMGLCRGWIDAYDFVLGRGPSSAYIDTIAYIPNAQMRAARDAIDAAWDAQDEAAIYEAFKNAFKFVPITGPEYRELKRQGLQ